MIQIPIESINLQLLNVGLERLNGDWNWKNVCSPFARVYYVKEGGALLHFTDRTVTLRPDHLYIVPAHTMHSCECDGPFTHYYLHVYEGFHNEISMMEFYQLPLEVSATGDEERIFQHMCDLLPYARLPEGNPSAYDNTTHLRSYIERYRNMPLWQKMELRGGILYLFSHFMREAVPRLWTADERLQRVLKYIHTNITRDMSVDELAAEACLTKPYFIRLFKSEVGMPPLRYINGKKVERAQLLLYTTDKPVKELAYDLGFSDHCYFIRLFRHITGDTPQGYRSHMKL